MEADEFLDAVVANGPFDAREDAEYASEAVVRTFGDRLSEGDVGDLAGLLPDRWGRVLLHADHDPAAQFGLDGFVERVAEREGVDEATAREHVDAVAAAFDEAAPRDRLRDATADLPPEYGRLFDQFES